MRQKKALLYVLLMAVVLVGGGLYIYFMMGSMFKNIVEGLGS